jgi:hypothetical protein
MRPLSSRYQLRQVDHTEPASRACSVALYAACTCGRTAIPRWPPCSTWRMQATMCCAWGSMYSSVEV